MYAKLSIRNGKRSIKDYLIFFVTLVISFSLMYSFNALSNQSSVKDIGISSELFSEVMNFFSFLMCIVMAFLIIYVSKFILSRRKKEFGTYMLLGMDRKKINWMFLMESVIIGFFSMIVGIFIGVFLTQGFQYILANLFDIQMKLDISLSLKSVNFTIIFFLVTYIFVSLFNYRILRKIKLYDLLNDHKKNEKIKSRNPKLYLVILILSVILFSISFYWTAYKCTSIKDMFIIILMNVLGTYGLYMSMGFVPVILKKHLKKWRYKKLNLFSSNQILSKINTNIFIMGTMSILLFITIASFLIGFTFSEALKSSLDNENPYEVMMTSKVLDVDYSAIEEYLSKSEFGLKDFTGVTVYALDSTQSQSLLTQHNYDHIMSRYGVDYISVVKYSDYKSLLRVLGHEAPVLNEGEFLMNSNWDYMKENLEDLASSNTSIKINGEILKTKESNLFTYSIGQSQGFAGYDVTFIVPDSLCENLTPVMSSFLGNTAVKPSAEFSDELGDFSWKWFKSNYAGENKVRSLWRYWSRTNVEIKQKTSTAVYRFVSMYIGIIFLIICCTVLSLHQLMDSSKNKHRFNILKKLGAEKSNINKSILKQISTYFLLPLILPVINVLFFGNVLSKGYLGDILPAHAFYKGLLISFGMFMIIYISYFIATVFGFKNSLENQ